MTARRHPETLRRSNLLPPALAVSCALSVAAPGKLRPAARAAVSGYAAIVLAAGVRSSQVAEQPLDSAVVPLALIAMHLAFGTGFLRGIVRHGPPLAAIVRAVGFPRLARRLGPPAEPVFAPSLARGVQPAVSQAPEPARDSLAKG
jgi:hypothetical protein